MAAGDGEGTDGLQSPHLPSGGPSTLSPKSFIFNWRVGEMWALGTFYSSCMLNVNLAFGPIQDK